MDELKSFHSILIQFTRKNNYLDLLFCKSLSTMNNFSHFSSAALLKNRIQNRLVFHVGCMLACRGYVSTLI